MPIYDSYDKEIKNKDISIIEEKVQEYIETLVEEKSLRPDQGTKYLSLKKSQLIALDDHYWTLRNESKAYADAVLKELTKSQERIERFALSGFCTLTEELINRT